MAQKYKQCTNAKGDGAFVMVDLKRTLQAQHVASCAVLIPAKMRFKCAVCNEWVFTDREINIAG